MSVASVIRQRFQRLEHDACLSRSAALRHAPAWHGGAGGTSLWQMAWCGPPASRTSSRARRHPTNQCRASRAPPKRLTYRLAREASASRRRRAGGRASRAAARPDTRDRLSNVPQRHRKRQALQSLIRAKKPSPSPGPTEDREQPTSLGSAGQPLASPCASLPPGSGATGKAKLKNSRSAGVRGSSRGARWSHDEGQEA